MLQYLHVFLDFAPREDGQCPKQIGHVVESLEVAKVRQTLLVIGHVASDKLNEIDRPLGLELHVVDFVILDKDVMLIGQGSHFEVWSLEAWDAQLEKIMTLGDRLLPPGMEKLSL